MRLFDAQRKVIGEARRATFETYEQARQHANNAVHRDPHVGAVVYAIRRGNPRDASFVPGEVREHS
jgi:hypothetical protein